MSGKIAHIVRLPRLYAGNYGKGTWQMKSLTDDVVDKILNGFSYSRLINCPSCEATIDLASQDIEAKSNFYFCANCGLTLPKPRKPKVILSTME